MQVSNKKLKEIIESVDSGLIFSVVFIKKDGSLRNMVCRKGVKSKLKGGEAAYDPADYDLVFVYDMQKEAYRSINLSRLVSAKIGGVEYIVRRKSDG